MNFVDAVKTCLMKYVGFEGRARRSEYWWWVLFLVVVSVVLAAVGAHMLGNVFSLATLLPSLAVGARRLHDIGKSGWWQLLALIPLIGWLVLIYWAVQPSDGDNDHGPAPSV
jgi:uncharacterized membrane protein YhaH (DUF805 family)